MSQLQRRCGHVRDRPFPATAVATGRGRANMPCYFTWQRPLHVDQAQQSLSYPFICGFKWITLTHTHTQFKVVCLIVIESAGEDNNSVRKSSQGRAGLV